MQGHLNMPAERGDKKTEKFQTRWDISKTDDFDIFLAMGSTCAPLSTHRSPHVTVLSSMSKLLQEFWRISLYVTDDAVAKLHVT